MKMVLAGLFAAALACAQATSGFELLGKFRGLGGLYASAVGPGPTAGSERLYLSYLYLANTIEVVAVDPLTGDSRVFRNPAEGEHGARCMVVGPDNNVYLGTLPRAHFLKLDVKAGKLIDLGRPSKTEKFIWDVAFGADGKLYGGTDPGARLVRYDPGTGALEDLGRMDPTERYAHYVAGSDDGFMYVGIGYSKANIIAYEIATGKHRSILPEAAQVVGQARVYRGADGKVYGGIVGRHFRLSGWTATPVPETEATPYRANRLRDGRTVHVRGRTLRILDPKTGSVETHGFAYAGNTLPLYRIGLGPDGALYGSTILPAHFVRLDPARHELETLGEVGPGEVYSMLVRHKRLLMAAYSGNAPLMAYDPAQPFHQGDGESNPDLLRFDGANGGWRPKALINGPDGRVYAGAVAGYGRLGGPLAVWDVDARRVDQYHHLVPDHSVVSLTAWKDRIVGGTSVEGGGGSHTTQTEARIFIWNPATRQKEFDAVPVPGAPSITDLITAPNGMVYGLAGRTLFVFDPGRREIAARKAAAIGEPIYNSVAVGGDGRIWGLAADGVFSINTRTNDVTLAGRSPEAITAGFAFDGRTIYFASGPSLYGYRIQTAGGR